MSVAGAYAIEHNGEIDVGSVSPTERAAKVNWLLTHCQYPTFRGTPDDMIEEAWLAFSSHHKAQCIPITIERKSL